MSWTPSNDVSVGNVLVATTMGGDHPPEFYAQRIVERLIAVSDQAPEPIRQQAYAFRDQMFVVVLDGLQRALASDRLYRKQES